MDHGIQRPLVKGNINRLGGHVIQLANISVLPGNSVKRAVSFRHVIHDDRREVHTDLILVPFLPKVFGYRLRTLVWPLGNIYDTS